MGHNLTYKQACMQEIGPSCDLNTQVFSHKVNHCTPAHPFMATKKNKNTCIFSSSFHFTNSSTKLLYRLLPLRIFQINKTRPAVPISVHPVRRKATGFCKIAYSYLKVALMSCVVGSAKQISKAERKRLQKLLCIYSRFK